MKRAEVRKFRRIFLRPGVIVLHYTNFKVNLITLSVRIGCECVPIRVLSLFWTHTPNGRLSNSEKN